MKNMKILIKMNLVVLSLVAFGFSANAEKMDRAETDIEFNDQIQVNLSETHELANDVRQLLNQTEDADQDIAQFIEIEIEADPATQDSAPKVSSDETEIVKTPAQDDSDKKAEVKKSREPSSISSIQYI